jgi:branched-subunit amino acid ABC-type transport system permease component
MVALLQAVFSGLALGGIYALVALGFSITHTTTKTFNFGQGEFLAVGTLIGVSAVLLLAGKDITEALQVSDVTPFRYAMGLIASVVVLGLAGGSAVLHGSAPLHGLCWLSLGHEYHWVWHHYSKYCPSHLGADSDCVAVTFG